MIDLNAYWQSSNYYRPAEFRYERPNANRPNAYVSDVPVQPGDARSVYVGDLAGEMIRRSSEAKGLVQQRNEDMETLRGLRAAAVRAQSAYDALKTAFVEKYGDVDPTKIPTEGEDRLELSEIAKRYLADLAALERQRMRIDQWTDCADRHEASMPRELAAREAGNESAAAGWSMRFAASKSERIEAFERFNEMSNRLAIFTAQSQLEHRRREVRAAATKAGNAALTAGLQGPALFKVADNGRIDFDATGLGHLTPDARQAEQLKRLVEIMSVRNGFSPLKGAVAEALAIQNAYIAAHPVVAGTLVLPY
ncbi:MAG: hypothetical protein JNL71_04250 [Rhodospirillales bacterium]|nr:hypothetical protein [Rhodospirillales bacterium]